MPPGKFSKKDVLQFIRQLSFVLADARYISLAQDYEHTVAMLSYAHISPAKCREYADFIVAPGMRGHVTLVLAPPEVARAIALLAWLVRSIDTE